VQEYSNAGPSAPPHPSVQSLYPNIDAPSPFPGLAAESPRNNGSSYFSSAASSSSAYPAINPPQHSNARTAAAPHTMKSNKTTSSRSRSPLKSEPLPAFQVSVSDPQVITEPSPISVPGIVSVHFCTPELLPSYPRVGLHT